MLTSLLLGSALAFTPSTNPSDPLPRRGTLGVGFSPITPDARQKLGLAPGRGVTAQKPQAGSTGEKAGLQPGDVLISLNGEPVIQGQLGEMARRLPSGKAVTFTVLREGKEVTLQAPLQERPRDPGNANYEVIYSHIVSNGQRMRTILTKPRKAGRHPGFMFIQGFSPLSYDYILEGSPNSIQTLAAPILFGFANDNYATLRIEKPGVGDSEGGPFAQLDYMTELDIYRQALKQLKEQTFVDPDNIFIFGHSMGGSFGPMIAAENPVKGLAVYGTASRTWHEYLLDSVRHQGLLAGGSFEAADESVRLNARLISLAFLEGKSAEDIKKSHPELSQAVDSLFPGGMFNQKSLEFWRQLGKINMPSYWVKTKAHVLAIKGASDYVVFDSDHKLIADVMNKVKPGSGRFMVAPKLDHVFNNWATEKESQQNWPNGTFNPDIVKILKDWTEEIRRLPAGS